MRVFERIFVNSVAAIINVIVTAIVGIIIYQYAGKINYWYWWATGALLVLGAISFYIIYQTSGKFPYTKFRVKKTFEEGASLKTRVDPFNGDLIGEAWKFETCKDIEDNVIYGPWLQQSLRKGKYRATFRMKLHSISGNYPIVNIEVASTTRKDGDTRLAGYTIITSDFKKADVYYDFPVDFHVKDEARKLEFRVRSRKSYVDERKTVVVDYIQLSRRLF